jgi:hypothetical protein
MVAVVADYKLHTHSKKFLKHLLPLFVRRLQDLDAVNVLSNAIWKSLVT